MLHNMDLAILSKNRHAVLSVKAMQCCSVSSISLITHRYSIIGSHRAAHPQGEYKKVTTLPATFVGISAVHTNLCINL